MFTSGKTETYSKEYKYPLYSILISCWKVTHSMDMFSWREESRFQWFMFGWFFFLQFSWSQMLLFVLNCLWKSLSGSEYYSGAQVPKLSQYLREARMSLSVLYHTNLFASQKFTQSLDKIASFSRHSWKQHYTPFHILLWNVLRFNSNPAYHCPSKVGH